MDIRPQEDRNSADSPGMMLTERRVYLCINGKCATREQAQRSFNRLLELVEKHLAPAGQSGRLKCKLVGCLDICENGPTLVIHPDRVWYQNVNEANIERIFFEHILNGRPVSSLIYRQGTES